MFACIEVWQQHERLLNYRAGLAPSATYNVYRSKNADPIEPLAFFETPKQTDPRQLLGTLTKLAKTAQRKRERKNGKPR